MLEKNNFLEQKTNIEINKEQSNSDCFLFLNIPYSYI